MDRHSSDSKKHSPQSVETSLYLEAYGQAVDVYCERDLRAWGKILTFQERFVLEAWMHPMPAEEKPGSMGFGRRHDRTSSARR